MLFCMLIFLSVLTRALYGETTISLENGEAATTENISIVRRKSPAKHALGTGGRLSLVNSRFSRRPRKKNLDTDQLLEILGDYYEPEWMSIEEPPALANKDPDRGVIYVVRHDGWQHSELIKQLQTSNLSLELAQLGGESVLQDPTFVTTVEKWLLNRASCPVRYAWEDIGSLFWPRYIKRGECASVPGTCSWPPGMHCVPSGTATLHVLRWQCKVPKGKGRRRVYKNSKDSKNKDWPRKINEGEQPANFKCNWIRVPYPITNECLCTC
ncbi:noggin-3-like [Stegodyphus dumicola]|uniref:noggin-3-like n=1 Tax=Stegodyphus dumicola TaxID=202533 RepID=UPI0015A93216|nr:noggin-3-like [Stegodyphus dumicola]